MTEKQTFNQTASVEFSELNRILLLLYVRTGLVLVPIVLLYQICGFFHWIEINIFQVLQGFIFIILCSLIIIFKKTNFVKLYIPIINVAFLMTASIIGVWWAVASPEDHSVLSLFLMVFGCGLVVIRPWMTVAYFVTIILSFLFIGLAADVVDLKLIFYLIIIAALITSFAFWTDTLINQKRRAAESYKNIFSDLSEQVFVLDQDLNILELNKTASNFVTKYISESVIGKNFNDVFCSRDEVDRLKFKEALSAVTSERIRKFEANCAITGTVHFLPKEFTLRKSKFFEKEVYILTARSLKEQRDFEEKLLESKDNISRVLENINSFVFNISYDRSGRRHQVNYVSNKVKDVFGIEVDEYITLIKSERLNEIFYHKDREEVGRQFDAVLETEQENRIKYRIIKNNEIRWVEEKIYPQKTNTLGIIHLFGIVTDITDQIEATDSLRSSEERYRQMFERNLAGVYKTHVDGTILDANQSFARILGYESIAELKKLNIRDLYFHKEDRKDYLDKLKNDGFINNYTSTLRRKDGKKLTVNNNVSIQPDEDGNMNIIEGTLIDVTDIEETATALKLSEEKYRLLFEDSSEGIILLSYIDTVARVLDANNGACRLLGYDEKQLKTKILADFAKNHEDLKLLFVGDKTSTKSNQEWIFRRSDSSEFVAEISYVTVQPGTEKIIQLVIKDISERKQNEEILRESQQSFKNIVDNSPAAIFIFSDHELVYTNPLGEKVFNEQLNRKSKKMVEIFPESMKYVLEDLVKENTPDTNAFTQIELSNNNETKQYSLNVVKTIYNNKKSHLFLLQDITLQTEYNRQKLRAEIAEDTNVKLQDEIERHRKTQAELVEKTFWLNALFESSYNLFILSLNKEYRISSFNENFKRMIAKSRGVQVKIGDVFLDIFDIKPAARKKIEDRFERVLKGETLEFISHFPTLANEVWVESFLNPVKLGNREVTEISFISHEITEKIESQRKIRESESNNRAILLALPDILTKVNKDGYFVDFRISQANGLDPVLAHLKTPVFVGNHVKDVIKDPEIAQKFLEIIEKVLRTNELETFTFELLQDDSGRPLYYENRFSKMTDNEVIVLARNVTETIEYEYMLFESVKEKEILLKEVHHRVKNNLQVINSILNLQSSYVDDPKTLEIINESQNRIRSMSYIHESLYQTKDFSAINFADYITNLVQNLVHSYQLYQDKIDLKLNIEPVKLALDQAIPCGLILNELVSNALKYAYPQDQKGQIVIEVYEKNGRLSIGVEDFGIGLPEDFQIENSESLGLSLVHTLVDQLDGELILKRLGGTKFLITFDKQEV
jgi:PAS domain S-box-containing protein